MIAIVGRACELPDARTPEQLWENVLAGRRAFRRLPPQRLALDDYLSFDRASEDRLYATEAALIEGYEFDRVRFRVPGETYRASDLTHWLALDVACRALADAGHPDGDGLPREATGVVLGNTLTGEMSRATGLRVRWPYVRRVIDEALSEHGLQREARRDLLARIERSYKAPFAPVGDESLAGALSNTIAGRICNHLDLGGGGYTVDGACSASLLAVITACQRLTSGELDVAVAGGVDVSLDPFELVGFAKTGALAPEEMRVYDARSQGFWPGEGCGCVVLMRHADAVACGAPIRAMIRGWGISSDGSGGITRPEIHGQLRALRRAYGQAQTDISDVAYFEGHGTGTAVGDPTEIRALAEAHASARRGKAAALGSVKANIGHTKAAAGVAGLIKAVSAVSAGVIPPTTGCRDPHPVLRELGDTLRATETAEPWAGTERVAGVSAFGFGGINTHVVVSSDRPVTPGRLRDRERLLLASTQDAELFLFAAMTPAAMRVAVDRLRGRASGLSRAQLADAASVLVSELGTGSVRAAVVASTPAELAARLAALASLLDAGVPASAGETAGVHLGTAQRTPRIGFLFPGQAAPAYAGGGAMLRRFPRIAELYREASTPPSDRTDTAFAQPAIVRASLAALRVLAAVRVDAEVAVGHSLGELTALAWAGAVDEATALRIATARGKAMAEHADGGGAMASVALDADGSRAVADGLPLVIAGLNAPEQTTLSGPVAAIDALVRRASARGVAASRLPVSHAFHSDAMAPAGAALRAALAGETIIAPARTVISTVTGAPVAHGEDVRELLLRQLTEPVRFLEATAVALEDLDLAIEVGPGHILTGLLHGSSVIRAVPTDAGGASLTGLLTAIGAAWALGAAVDVSPLFEQRFTRPIDLDRPPLLFSNPCERAPRIDDAAPPIDPHQQHPADDDGEAVAPEDAPSLVRAILSARTELPMDAVLPQSRLLDDLHLNSMVVSEIAVEAARRLGLPPPLTPTALANATVEDLATAVASGRMVGEDDPDLDPPGAGSWTRAFTMQLVERQLQASRGVAGVERGAWHVVARRGDRLGAELVEGLGSDARGGVALVLPADPDVEELPLLLRAARAVLGGDHPRRLVVAQSGGGGGGFARSLHLEAPDVATLVVDLPRDARRARIVAAEAAAHGSGFAEARYDDDGVRRQPVLRHLPLEGAETDVCLTADDVVLLAGGTTGIAAECAMRLVDGTNAAVACIGRSDPASEPALAAALGRLRTVARDVTYVRADVTDAAVVAAALGTIQASLGRVTAVLHAAGRNQPTALRDLSEEQLRATVAPKVLGLRNVVAALRDSPLRMLVTFGSIIGRAGMRGDAHYAVANEWQTLVTERFAVEHPDCACLAFESSVWASIGMGERLGSVEALARAGVDAIPPDEGAALLARLATTSARPVAVVAAGRVGRMRTLERERADLPLRRFLDRPRAEYPGIEIVADADLSLDVDPYLTDHVLDGQPLVPGVVGMEAMAQVVMALAGLDAPPVFEDVRFDRPLVVPERERTTVRVAALATDPDRGRVVVRSDRTGFQVDHFSARWRTGAIAGRRVDVALASHDVGLDSAGLYGTLLFQGERFQRLRRYVALGATRCRAEVEATDGGRWFETYLPRHLELGDLGAHDAAIHALQACVPHKRVIPVAAEAVWFAPDARVGTWVVHAEERFHGEDSFTFDVSVVDADDREIARWSGLQLRTVGAWAPVGSWPPALLATYVERCVQPLDHEAHVALIEAGRGRRPEASELAIQAAVGGPVPVWRGADRRPWAQGRLAVSAAHANGLTFAVAGEGFVACDIEVATARSRDVWRDLLGPVGVSLSETIAADRDEDLTMAATRVWAARECLQKIGAPLDTTLTLAASAEDGWVTLRNGERPVATFVAHIAGIDEPVALAVLTRGANARL